MIAIGDECDDTPSSSLEFPADVDISLSTNGLIEVVVGVAGGVVGAIEIFRRWISLRRDFSPLRK